MKESLEQSQINLVGVQNESSSRADQILKQEQQIESQTSLIKELKSKFEKKAEQMQAMSGSIMSSDHQKADLITKNEQLLKEIEALTA